MNTHLIPPTKPSPAWKQTGLARLLFVVGLLPIWALNTNAAPTIWSGSPITFTKAPNADPTSAANQDRITDSVWITRGFSQGIYNAKTEVGYSGSSPADTEWAYGTTADYENLTFQSWFSWVASNPPGTIGQDAVLHLISEDIYIDIKFTSWGDGHDAPGGGFSYQRSTPSSSPNTAPSISIISPTNGAAFNTPANVVIETTADDSDGTVVSVEFFDGNVSLGIDTTSPFSITNNFFPGSHTLTAVAMDNDGATNVSSGVTISVSSTSIPNPIAERIPKGEIMIEVVTIADGMASPLGVAAPDDGSGRLFVYDQSGPIWVVTPNGKLETPLIDLRARLIPSAKYDYDERGLLGMAVHPNFAENPYIYTYTSESNSGPADFAALMNPGTQPNHQSVIAEWRIDPLNPNRVDPASRREIMRVDQPQSNHNGGAMRFGPDGLLYITIGDGGQANDVGNGHVPGGNSQDLSQVLGKLLRIDVDGNNSANGQYGIPLDNPFDGTNGLREIFALGLRNPFSFSFDKTEGTLYLADVGQNRVEEIDIITKGGNYGWNIREGTFWFDSSIGQIVTAPTRPVPPDLIDPIAQYDHDDGLAIIGGHVYRGAAIPELQGRYVFADWGAFNAPSGRLYYLDSGNVIKEFKLGLNDRPFGHWIKGMGEGPDGEIYILCSRVVGPAGNTGKLLKIVPGPEPLVFNSISKNGANLAEVWCGGMGPYAVQKKSTLNDLAWYNLNFTTETNIVTPADRGAGFFRVADTANQRAIPLSAYLTGLAERPTPVTNSATGSALFSLEGNTLTFNIHYTGLSAPAFAAHIHGPATTATATNILIDLAPFNGGSYGSSGTIAGAVVLSDAHKAMVLAGLTYVNLHTPDHPPGELRGQIAPVLMQATFSGAAQNPAVNTKGNGIGMFALVGNQLTFNITYRDLSGPAFDAHIHGPASMGQNAGVIVPLAGFNGGSFSTNGTLSGTVTLTPSVLAAVIDGRTYVNFHTPANAGGEIRGQILPQSTAVPFTAPLTGLSERPTPITNNASGSAFFSLEGNTLLFSIDYKNLSGTAIAAHIHGPATTSQSTNILIDLSPYKGSGFGVKGTFAGSVVLTPEQRDLVLNGRTYVNVHTGSNPSGEIRGQIAPVLMRAYLSGASERPPLFSNGNGLGTFALVLNQLSFNIAYRDLTTTANNAHIHGPSPINQSANILVDLQPFNGGAWNTSGSLVGTTTLSSTILGHIVDHLTYVNVHSTTFGGGEIRGHVLR